MAREAEILQTACHMIAHHGPFAIDTARTRADAVRDANRNEAGNWDRVADTIYLIESERVPQFALSGVHEFSDSRLVRLLNQWQDAKGGAPAMRRADFAMDAFGDLLPMLNLIEVSAGGTRFRHRMVGGTLVKQLGRDGTGQYVGEDLYGPAAAEVARSLEKIAGEVRPYRRRSNLTWNHQSWLMSDSVELPLIEPDGRVSMILRATSFFATAHPPSQRLNFQPL